MKYLHLPSLGQKKGTSNWGPLLPAPSWGADSVLPVLGSMDNRRGLKTQCLLLRCFAVHCPEQWLQTTRMMRKVLVTMAILCSRVLSHHSPGAGKHGGHPLPHRKWGLVLLPTFSSKKGAIQREHSPQVTSRWSQGLGTIVTEPAWCKHQQEVLSVQF